MSAYYHLSVRELLASSVGGVVGQIARNQAGTRREQLNAWEAEVLLLRDALFEIHTVIDEAADWSLLFEYQMRRLQRRIDLVLLANDVIFSIEFKMGGTHYEAADRRQADDYAFDLRDFHAASRGVCIVPVLCATEAPVAPLELKITQEVTSLVCANSENLSGLIREVWRKVHSNASPTLDAGAWESASYAPVPTIIEAAEELYGANDVREIHEALANHRNLTDTTDRLIDLIVDAQRNKKHRICFVTGVPGSGKTLTGLNAVHDPRFKHDDDEGAAFLSGNTPLVAVLREALARDQAKREGVRIGDARNKTRAGIQNLMDFLREYLDNDTENPPHEHVVVFDEAQRAWDEAYGRQKFGRQASEPELVLSIMSRHADWSVVIALVGGGQEINKGEGGLQLWGEALKKVNGDGTGMSWEIVASPHVLTGSAVTAGSGLFDESPANVKILEDDSLHLPVSIRSHRCEVTNEWVEAVLAGNRFEARRKANELADFRIYITRSLDQMNSWLTAATRGRRRCGLLASSGARRLRAYGLGVNVGATDLSGVVNWFLQPREDVRSSYSLEVTANEYACQGLELDNIGLCWGGDFLWKEGPGWQYRAFSGTRWNQVARSATKENIRNTYRVLMSRARDSLVIWVPPGDETDPTRDPEMLDETARYLRACGVNELPALDLIEHSEERGS